MTMSARLSRLTLTAHVSASVGWLGAVAAFLTVAVAGVASSDAATVRGAYLSMELMGRFVLVPLSIASLATGLVQSLGSTWGLLRHYWVLAKLVINVFANIVLLMYMETLAFMSDVASSPVQADAAVLRNPTAIVHAAGALVVLLIATVLSIYKPRGVTPYGRRKQRGQRAVTQGSGA